MLLDGGGRVVPWLDPKKALHEEVPCTADLCMVPIGDLDLLHSIAPIWSLADER